MNLREQFEKREHEYFSPYASFSDQTKGRNVYQKPCDMRTEYQRDRDRILHSKSFRRLKGKTQVFLAPEGDHYRNRLTHTLEVSQNARTIAKALHMNEDLAEAIALGHDLGHTPFGHAGERALNQVTPFSFFHEAQSVRVVEVLEKDGKGLNLTWEVLDGISNHSLSSMPHTMEGKIVRLSDKIAYVNSDVDDAIRGGIIRGSDLPELSKKVLGNSLRERLNICIHDVISESKNQHEISMSEEVWNAFMELRTFMNEHVYSHSEAKMEEGKAEHMVQELYSYYVSNPDKLPPEFKKIAESEELNYSKERAACDYVAGMTDQYAIAIYENLMIPKRWDIY